MSGRIYDGEEYDAAIDLLRETEAKLARAEKLLEEAARIMRDARGLLQREGYKAPVITVWLSRYEAEKP